MPIYCAGIVFVSNWSAPYRSEMAIQAHLQIQNLTVHTLTFRFAAYIYALYVITYMLQFIGIHMFYVSLCVGKSRDTNLMYP